MAAATSATEKPKLTYWPIAGLGCAPRLALIHAVGMDGFVNDMITDYGEFAKQAQLQECALLNMPFVTFPGNKIPVSQSNAVLTAIGRRYGLNGNTVDEQDRNDEALAQLQDLQNEYISMTYRCKKEEFDEYKSSFLAKSVPYYIGGLAKLMSVAQTPFVAGNSVTVADFRLWSFIEAIRVLTGAADRESVVKAHCDLFVDWLKAMEALPAVKTYDAQFHDIPQNGQTAHWSPRTA